MDCRYNRTGTYHTYHPRAMEFIEGGGKVLQCPTHLTGRYQLEVKRSEENFVREWNYFLLKEVHFHMAMRA
jgi:hypothetical protein